MGIGCFILCVVSLISCSLSDLIPQDVEIIHESARKVSNSKFAEIKSMDVLMEPGQKPCLNFVVVTSKTLDNTYMVGLEVKMKFTDDQPDYLRLSYSTLPFCDILKKSTTARGFEKYGNFTEECPKPPGTYVVSQHVFAGDNQPPVAVAGKKLKANIYVWKGVDKLQIEYTANLNKRDEKPRITEG